MEKNNKSKFSNAGLIGFQFNNKNPKNVYEIIFKILSVYNCRISEILSAEWSNFFHNRFLILDGKKHSQPIIITDREILSAISNLPHSSNHLIFSSVTYNSFYHYVKKNFSHLFSNIKTRKYSKVTHAFRYLNISGVDNDKFIKQILHHNSTKSGIYYKNKLKG